MESLDEFRRKYEKRLKACPCCGGDHLAIGVTHITDGDECAEVYCLDCDLVMYSTHWDTPEEAIVAATVKWNWRRWSSSRRDSDISYVYSDAEMDVAVECNRRLDQRRYDNEREEA